MNKHAYRIDRLYMKSASIEVPDMPHLPKQALQPEIGVDFQTDVKSASSGQIECVLTIALHARLRGKTLFLIEVGQAGLFRVSLANSAEATEFAKQAAAQALFPYARKHLAAMAVSAGFQPVILDHVDFGSLLDRLAARTGTKPHAPLAQEAGVRSPVASASAATRSTPAVAGGKPAPPTTRQDTGATGATAPAAKIPPVVAHAPTNPSLAGRTGLLSGPRPALIVAVLAFAAVAAWWVSRDTTLLSEHPSAKAAPSAIRRSPGEEAEKLRLRGEHIIAASKARFDDQADTAYTLQLGTVPAADLLPAFDTLRLQRPLWAHRRPDGTLEILYGVFPDATLAQAAEAELPQQLPSILTLRKQVQRIGELRSAGVPASAVAASPAKAH